MGLCLYIDTPDAPRIQAELLYAYRLAAREPASSPLQEAVWDVVQSLNERLDQSRWSSGYSHFGHVRSALAAALGVSLLDVWAADPDALVRSAGAVALFDHSDCDGELTADECARITATLTPVLELVDEDLRDDARSLLEFLALAASSDSTVVFA